MIKYFLIVAMGFFLANVYADLNYFIALYGIICFWFGYLVKVNKEE